MSKRCARDFFVGPALVGQQNSTSTSTSTSMASSIDNLERCKDALQAAAALSKVKDRRAAASAAGLVIDASATHTHIRSKKKQKQVCRNLWPDACPVTLLSFRHVPHTITRPKRTVSGSYYNGLEQEVQNVSGKSFV